MDAQFSAASCSEVPNKQRIRKSRSTTHGAEESGGDRKASGWARGLEILSLLRKGIIMNHPTLPDHPAAREEYLRLQDTCDAVAREIAEVEALTGAKAGE